jgi:hypothetical protein
LKEDPSFPREYQCAYGHNLGNIFLPREIEACLAEPTEYNNACTTSIGIDIGFGSSATAITVIQLMDGKLHVIYSKQFQRPSYEDMINLCVELNYRYKPAKIYVDGSAVDFVKSLKLKLNENVNYEDVIKRAVAEKIDPEYRLGLVIPVSFAEHGRELLGRFQHIVSKGWFRVSEREHSDLVLDMRTATYKENGNLDKSETNARTFDSFDSCRLALKNYPLAKKVI